jgi:hypothetical protein
MVRGSTSSRRCSSILRRTSSSAPVRPSSTRTRANAWKKVGPDIGGERTSIGGHLVFGVWWGGEGDRPPETEEKKHEPRFGESGQVVFSGDFGIGGGRTTFAGTRSSTESFTLAPGVDYFAARHVSVGIAFSYGFTNSTGLRADGTPAMSKTRGGGLSPRLGVDIPLTSWLSFYPRGSLRFGSRTFETRAGQDGYEYTEGFATASLHAPLLVHPAPHAFVGFGPFVSYDLVRKVEGTSDGTPGTSVGASLVVGGWL